LDIEKGKCYNSNGTQTTFVEEKENDDEQIGDDIEIIPNLVQDDFVQLDLHEYNEQSNMVRDFSQEIYHFLSQIFFRLLVSE